MSEWMTAKEVQDFLKISEPTLYRRIKEGILKPHKMEGSNRNRFKRSEVEATMQPVSTTHE